MVMTLSDIVKDGIAQARLGYYRDAVEQFSRAIQLDRTCTKAFLQSRVWLPRPGRSIRRLLEDYFCGHSA